MSKEDYPKYNFNWFQLSGLFIESCTRIIEQEKEAEKNDAKNEVL